MRNDDLPGTKGEQCFEVPNSTDDICILASPGTKFAEVWTLSRNGISVQEGNKLDVVLYAFF